MLQPFLSEIFWFERLSFSWNRVSWLCQSACGECFLCWVTRAVCQEMRILKLNRSREVEVLKTYEEDILSARYDLDGSLISSWRRLEELLSASFWEPDPSLLACLPHQNHLFSFYLHPTSLLPSSRHICTRYIARPAQKSSVLFISLPEDLQYSKKGPFWKGLF